MHITYLSVKGTIMELYFFMPLIMIIAAYLAILVAVIQLKQDSSIANAAWCGGCLIVALYTLIMHGRYLPRHIIVTTMVALWAIRLIIYVYLRYKGNDPRFQSWKQSGIKALIFNIAYLFGAQAFFMTVTSIPIILINMSNVPGLNYLDLGAIGLWLIGYFFEAVADYQLFMFTRNPAHKGRVMRYGLWHYSRHPNYFGEIVMWWAIFLLALSVPDGIFGIMAPIAVTITLVWVTGIPWVEKAMDKNPEYQEYKRTTSALIPWGSKK